MKSIALSLFVLTYMALLLLPKYRSYIALASAVLFVSFGLLPLDQILHTIDFNVLLMIGGTMGIVSLFIDSKMPALLADWILDRTPNVKWAIIALALFAGFISAFVDNVATVLMIAPVALTISKKLKIDPVLPIIAIAVSSNLQGAATLVGDTTAILLGGYAGMDFLDFFFLDGKIGIFWVVQFGAFASTFVLLYLFKQHTQVIHLQEKTKVNDFFPSFLLVAMILLLILASFIPNKLDITNGLIATTLLFIGLLKEYLEDRKLSKFVKTILEIDFETLLLLASLFIIIGGITYVGLIDDMSSLFVQLTGDNIFLIYTVLVWFSVFVSAFVDNIPYIATMLPVVSGISISLGLDPMVLYLGLLTGATLGGNLTPIGASANITAIGILRKSGHPVSTKQFMSIGIPFTLVAVLSGYVLIWLIYA